MPPRSELVIMQGGPLHRRVYYLEDIPTPCPYRDAGRLATAPLGEINGKLVPHELADAFPRVWQYIGEEKPIQPPTPGARGFGRSCTYRGCLTPAAYRIGGELERKPWFGCEEHKAGMVAALAIGRASGYSVDAIPC